MQSRKWKNFNIDIFGTKWKVKFEDQVYNKFNDNAWVFGITVGYSRTIFVSKKDVDGNPIPDEEIEATVMHELIHAVLDTGQYNQSSADEPLVEWLSKCFLMLLHKDILGKAYEKR